MVGTGSTLVAALRSGRHSYGLELNQVYADIARHVVDEERESLGEYAKDLVAEVITGNASHFNDIAKNRDMPPVDYIITSPPYWNMLRERGAETQKKRRISPELDVFYSEDTNDLGNIDDYDEFIERLIDIYKQLKTQLKPRAYMTIIVKNVKKGGKVYPLAWDLANHLGKIYTLKDEKIWVQDNQRLAPYGFGSAWVSNTFHHYCLQFRNE
jgi:DNA modification methylase